MCTGAEMFLIGATAYNALGTLQQGKDEQRAYEMRASQSEADAAAEREAAALRAAKVRRAGRVQQSEVKAAYGASGVVADKGSAETVQTAVGRLSELDALNEILYGERRAVADQQQAAFERAAGSNAAAGARRKALGSILSTGAVLAGGWASPNLLVSRTASSSSSSPYTGPNPGDSATRIA